MHPDGRTRPPSVYVLPINGLGNRLRGVASAAHIAAWRGGEFAVAWESSDDLRALREDLFESWKGVRFIGSGNITDRIDRPVAEIGQGVVSDAARRLITVRGGRRRDSELAPALRSALSSHRDYDVVLVGGGNLSLEGPDELAEMKRRLYPGLLPSPAVRSILDCSLPPGRFVGLHLRYTDRRHQAPDDRCILKACRRAAVFARTRSVYVAADDPAERSRWCMLLRSASLVPLAPEALESWSRASVPGVQGAVAEWFILARATALVRFRSTSFAAEAAILREAGTGPRRSSLTDFVLREA